MKVLKKITISAAIIVLSILQGCKAPSKNPLGELDTLVSEYGFIGYQNPLEESGTGTMLSGRPSSLAFIAGSEDCFPKDQVPRRYDHSNFSKSYEYTFKGDLGFLASATPIVTAKAGIKKDFYVQVKLEGITIEYMSGIDITRWYNDGLDDVCKKYLDKVGFVAQALSTDKLTLSIVDSKGSYIELKADNLSTYFGVAVGIEWNITNRYNLNITTPKYIGYQLGSLRKSDLGMTLYRAMSTKNDKFVFEALALFDSPELKNQKSSLLVRGNSSLLRRSLDSNSLYVDNNK